jgi:hypothetical protein
LETGFDLYQKLESEWQQIVHVSFKPENDDQKKGVQSMAVDGVAAPAAGVLTNEVFPAVKDAATGDTTEPKKQAVHNSIAKSVVKKLEV